MNMIIPVHMLSFADENDRSVIRQVEIPIQTIQDPSSFADGNEINSVLEMVFKYGQNEFQTHQPQSICSVSVGDVIQLGHRYFIIMGVGFKELSKDEFEKLPVPSATYAYMMGLN